MNRLKIKYYLFESSKLIKSLPESGTREYTDHVDELIDNLRDVKNTLRSGKDRYKFRKESSNLQRAIEALRYLRRKNEKLLEDDDKKIDRIVEKLQKFNMTTKLPIAKCNVPATLKALGIKNTEVQKAATTAFGDLIPFYLCDVTTAAAEIYAKYFITSLSKFNNIIDKVFKEIIPVRRKTYEKNDFTKQLKDFDLLNKDNIFINASSDKPSFHSLDKIHEKRIRAMKQLQHISLTGYNITDRIFNIIFDDNIKSNPEISALINEINTIFQKEQQEALNNASGDPQQTKQKANIQNDFLNGAINILKKRYEKDYPGEWPSTY